MKNVFGMDETELRAEVTRLRGVIERNGKRYRAQTGQLDECKRARHELAKEVTKLRQQPKDPLGGIFGGFGK